MAILITVNSYYNKASDSGILVDHIFRLCYV